MALNSSSFLIIIIPLFFFFFPLFSSPVFSLSSRNRLSDPPRALLVEEKTRLGSTPPSCYNKCNECHPCSAVQVPTLPSLDRVQPPTPSHENRASSVEILGYNDWGSGNNRYSNYKPLGWKCRCKNHLYNP